MSDEDVISLSDPDSEGTEKIDSVAILIKRCLCSENTFLGMARGVLMMLVSRRRPRYPAPTGQERRRKTKEAQGGEERTASGREGRKEKKVIILVWKSFLNIDSCLFRRREDESGRERDREHRRREDRGGIRDRREERDHRDGRSRSGGSDNSDLRHRLNRDRYSFPLFPFFSPFVKI